MPRRSLFSFMVLLSMAAACGDAVQTLSSAPGSDAALTDPDEPATADDDSGTSANDAAAKKDAAPKRDGGKHDAGAGDSATPPAAGDVGKLTIFQSSPPIVAAESSGLTGGFRANEPATEAGCTKTAAGPCTITSCVRFVDAGAPPQWESAGTLTVSGGSLSGTKTISPALDTTYYAEWNGLAFQPGQTLTVSGSGDAVPSFSNTVATPTPIAITSSSFTLTAAAHVDRDKDLTIAWTGGDASTNLHLSLASRGDADFAVLECVQKTTAGSITVPAATLQALPEALASPANYLGDFDVSVAVTTPVMTVGTFRTTLETWSSMHAGRFTN
jgi:hypothetical protein